MYGLDFWIIGVEGFFVGDGMGWGGVGVYIFGVLPTFFYKLKFFESVSSPMKKKSQQLLQYPRIFF